MNALRFDRMVKIDPAKIIRWHETHADRGCNDAPTCGARTCPGCHCRCDDHECFSIVHPTPLCPTCRDAKILRRPRDVSQGGFYQFGTQVVPCPSCSPADPAERMAIVKISSGIEPEMWSRYRPELLRPVDGWHPLYRVREWLAQSAKQFLVLIGPPGTGKTHVAIAAAALYAQATDGRNFIAYAPVPDLLQEMRSTYDDTERDLASVVSFYRNAGLLVLDDFGAEKMSEWTEEQLTRLIDHRMMNGARTVITTNLNPSEVGNARLRSRIYGEQHALLVHARGTDQRRPGSL